MHLSGAVRRVSVAGASKRDPKKGGGHQRRGEGRVRDERVRGETVGFCGIEVPAANEVEGEALIVRAGALAFAIGSGPLSASEEL